MHKRDRRIQSGAVGLVVAIIASVLYATPTASVWRQQIAISGGGARPLAEAVEMLERRYHWTINYEDPPYLYAGDLNDLSAQVRRDGTVGKPKVLVPRGGTFSVPDIGTPHEIMSEPRLLLSRIVSAFNASGLPGQFTVLQDGGTFHVVPAGVRNRLGILETQGSVLDSKITIAPADRNALTMIDAVADALTMATGTRVYVGLVPDKILASTRVTTGANQEEARRVLVRTLAATGRNLAWQLFYYPGEAMSGYYLNLHLVKSAD